MAPRLSADLTQLCHCLRVRLCPSRTTFVYTDLLRMRAILRLASRQANATNFTVEALRILTTSHQPCLDDRLCGTIS